MVRINLKGIHKVTAKGRTYWYAWRGGPRLCGDSGSPEFVTSYNEAVASLKAPDTSRFLSLVQAYRGSREFEKLADSTRKNWSPWLDRIGKHFGALSVVQFDRPEKVRPIIRQWRNQWADKPRTADYAMQVLSRVLAYGVDPLGRIAGNPAEGIARLYHSDRSDKIWTPVDIGMLKKSCSPAIAHAVELAAHTGLREGDIVRLTWKHVGDDAIRIATGKSRHRKVAIIPLYDDLRSVLAAIPRVSPSVLTDQRGRPWSANGLSKAVGRARAQAGLGDLHFHDLRGTAATRFYLAKLDIRVIAEILAWSEAEVDKIIRRYVSPTAAVVALLNQK